MTTAFERHLVVKDFTEMDQHVCSLSLDKYYEQKMGEGAQKTVSCTKA